MTYDPYAFDGLAGVGQALARADREAHPLSLEHPDMRARPNVRRACPWNARIPWRAECPICRWQKRTPTQPDATAALDKHLRSGYHRPWFELTVPRVGRVAAYRDGLEIG